MCDGLNRSSFVVYENWYKAMQGLQAEQKAACFDAMCEYALYGNEVNEEPVAMMFMQMVKPVIDKNNAKYLNAKKGGRPKKEQEQPPKVETVEKPKTKRFQKPTVEEIQAYCSERNNKVDAEKFFSYYESNGWKVGKNPMKDWRAAIRNWEKSNFGKPHEKEVLPEYMKQQSTAQDVDTNERQQLIDMIRKMQGKEDKK